MGNQSVVVIIDVKKSFFKGYEIFINNGKKKINKNLFLFLNEIELNGAGEIVINNIDQDGTLKGYDLSLIEKVRERISVPITVLGGAGSLKDIQKLINKFKIIGAQLGVYLYLWGKYRAVLINYPSIDEKNELIKI